VTLAVFNKQIKDIVMERNWNGDTVDWDPNFTRNPAVRKSQNGNVLNGAKDGARSAAAQRISPRCAASQS